MELEFTPDAATFLAAAGPHLAAAPVLSTVVATLADRQVTQRADGIAIPDDQWFLTVRTGSGVVGAGMRTATFGRRPAYLLPMPGAATLELARVLHERGEGLTAVHGVLPVVSDLLSELARLAGHGTVEVRVRTRLFELGTLVPPVGVPGALRAVRPGEAGLAAAWLAAFDAESHDDRHDAPDRDDVGYRIAKGRLWFWEHDGQPVHLTGTNPPVAGVGRIGPVYTPPEQRGRGWASAAVAEASRLLAATGAGVCLFTDLANPTSNKIYRRIGYRPVTDMAELVLV
ncbi:GNAT family N-acetyltransferase [Nocardia harenae]|uniref:GNAT family N-acetyltransferase n=1 Tax=Nocardia harenae TaxID=358707 RepID=UPI00082AC7D5|nr:GNAT family N-acetyltransferase [Nocardia harenae]